jgi:hypothetical protein
MRSLLYSALPVLLISGLVSTSAAFAGPGNSPRPSPRSDACPIGLTATQDSNQSLLRTLRGQAPTPSTDLPAQALRIAIHNKRLPRIVAVDLDVHGTSPGARIIAKDAAKDALHSPAAFHTEDAVKHVHLNSSVASDQRVLEDVTVAALTSVASIEVTELRYADGSVWHASPYAQCETPPDSFMLIADK